MAGTRERTTRSSSRPVQTRAGTTSTSGYPLLVEAYHAFHTGLIAKSPRTAENYAAALRRFNEFLRDTAPTPKVMTTDQIDGRTLEAFYVWLLEQRGRAAKRTAITYVAGVRALIGRVPYPTPRIDEAVARVITYVNELPLPPAMPQTRQARLTLLRD